MNLIGRKIPRASTYCGLGRNASNHGIVASFDIPGSRLLDAAMLIRR